jgi:hypothetical protein
MTTSSWILTVIALIGCGKLLFDAVFAIGRWTKTVEQPDGTVIRKAPMTLERVGWELESIAKDIKELRSMFDTRYAELAAKVTADHQELRELRNWRAGLLSELGEHFHPIGIVDRMARESEQDRKSLHERLTLVEGIVNRRTDLRP